MKDLIVKPAITINQAMKKLDETAEKCLLITDEKNHLLGTLTDGDIRRAILCGALISSSISGIYNKKPIIFNSDSFDKNHIKKIFLQNKIDLIPIVNKKNNLVGYKTWDSVFGNGNRRKLKTLNVPH